MSKIEFPITSEEVKEHGPKQRFGPGNYQFQITEVSAGESPDKKTPRLTAKMVVFFNGEEYSVFDDIYLTDGAKWRYIQFLKGLGIDPTDEDLDTDDMAGIEGVLRMRRKPDAKYMDVGEYYCASVKDLEPLGPFEPKAPTYQASGEGEDNVPF